MRNYFIFSAVAAGFCLSIFFDSLAFAQAKGDAGVLHVPNAGFFVGKVLPNGISTTDEIFSLWGLRYSHPTKKGLGFYDLAIEGANSSGVNWKNASVGMSMHIPIETLVGHVGLGLDVTRYETAGTNSTTVGGSHFIGGVLSQIGGNVFARFDMKLNSQPGTSLFFGLGLVMYLDGAAAGGGDNP